MSTTDRLLAAAETAWSQRRAADALDLYRRVLDVDPEECIALRRLAWLEDDLGNPARAVVLLHRLAARQPGDGRVHQDLGLCLAKLGRAEESLAEFHRATEVDPGYAPGFCNLGLALEERGDVAGAIKSLGRALELRPESGFIAYHLAALGGGAAPRVCPAEYLVPLFDGYADRFDHHLVEELSYRGPAHLAAIVAGMGTGHARPKPWDLIDLGCGTGLTAIPFRSEARSILGIDLSTRMLQRASQRVMPDGSRVYDALVQADIVSALRQRPQSADLILAADVFIYIGDLAPVLAAIRDALRPGGLAAFTTESFPGPGDFGLLPTRRYAQSGAYIAKLAGELGLTPIDRREEFLRRGDDGLPLRGDVHLLQNPATTLGGSINEQNKSQG